ncbi:MAG: OadG family protein [Eubacterium sp.]|nr:OadG family protein [Eubacterium sp.]MCM1216477.1 OadG family protein [Lachnospiraceae bacterium]MCM1304808.1 OadG family protein [Butyrivibrio sp.]MCM1344035.1 OadG family protein [Muribaculaceae bacterium]MCM1240257.1 OadG family protein [Lachnospiraceae bacterium]
MKKFLTLLCMIACIFGLTACGGEEELSEREQAKLEVAQDRVVNQVIPMFVSLMDDEMAGYFDGYTLDEITYIMGAEYQLNMTGYAVTNAIESFHSAKDQTGTIPISSLQQPSDVQARIDGDTIIVEVTLQGEKKDAVAEVIVTNDMFYSVESASLNPVSTMGDLMTKAAFNTLIGMGTVFTVLILISLIISCFGVIPRLQAKMAKKPAVEAVESAPAQSVVQEEVLDETDDLELVAVIAAAIAACQGAASTDGFVVRSIRRKV